MRIVSTILSGGRGLWYHVGSRDVHAPLRGHVREDSKEEDDAARDLAHGFTVRDLERSVAFYRDVLGMELVHTQRQANPYTRTLVGYTVADLKVAMLRLPGTDPRPSGHVLELVEYVFPRRHPIDVSTPNPGSPHPAFAVDDIQDAYTRLGARGVEFRSPPVRIEEGRNKGGFAVYLRDPDGITLEFLQPPSHMQAR
jgi:catechol 2,3-dioxygenase-like lactoylglutathione lyase family enzyme